MLSWVTRRPGDRRSTSAPVIIRAASTLRTDRRLLPRYREVARREAIARERADQEVVCSVRWDAYGRDAYGRQARCLSPVAFAVPSALMVPLTTSLRFTGGPLRPQITQGPIPIAGGGGADDDGRGWRATS